MKKSTCFVVGAVSSVLMCATHSSLRCEDRFLLVTLSPPIEITSYSTIHVELKLLENGDKPIAGEIVTATLKKNGIAQTGMLKNETATSDSQGFARFIDLAIQNVTGNLTLEFSGRGFSKSIPIRVTPVQEPREIQFEPEPPGQVVRGDTSDVTAKILGTDGNPIKGIVVSAAVVPPYPRCQWNAKTDENGLVRFRIVITGPLNRVRLRLSTAKTSEDSDTIIVSSGTPKMIELEPPLHRPRVGEVIGGSLKARILNEYSQPIPEAEVGIRTTSEKLMVKNSVGKTDVQGWTMFDSATFVGTPESHQIYLEAMGVRSKEVSVQLRTGDPRRLLVTTQPSGTTISDSLLKTTKVRVIDDADNPIAGVAVSVALPSRAASARSTPAYLSGTLLRNSNQNGEAEFDDLRLTGPSGTYTLVFSAPLAKTVEAVPSRPILYDADQVFDRSYVIVSAIKTISGKTPENEFFDLRFRFRVPPLSILASIDAALSTKQADSANSKEKTLADASLLFNWEFHSVRREVDEIPERSLFGGLTLRVFNTIPFVGLHCGSIELGGSVFKGSSMSIGIVFPLYSNQVVVEGDTIKPPHRSLFIDFFVRSSIIEFFKLLTVRAGILLPLGADNLVLARIAIAVPIGGFDWF